MRIASPTLRRGIALISSFRLKHLARGLQRVRIPPLLAEILTIIGGLVFFAHLWGHAHGQQSVIDEGLYLYKGYLFASGRYIPFEDLGPWTNHMPLSFFIPGWVQQIFGLGIRTGRYYAIGLGILRMLGLWVVSRRLGGRWLAAGAIWIVALNPVLVKKYSQAVSQGLVATMLVWVMVFTLGERRRIWQLIVGSMLAGTIVLTRINLVPVLPLLIGYIFWQHGKRAGLISSAAGLLVVTVGHAIYWPEILKIWAKWLPASITPFLDSWRFLSPAEPMWNPTVALRARINSLVLAIQRHALPILGLLFAWLSWRSPSPPWRARPTEKTVYFLSALFVILFAIHAWVSLTLNYCVFCLQAYVTFFSLLGILLFVVSAKRWYPSLSWERQVLIILIILGVAVLIGPQTIRDFIPSLLATQVPRVSSLTLQPGTVDLSTFIQNKFGMPLHLQSQILDLALMTWATLFLASAGIALGWLLLRRKLKRYPRPLFLFFAGTGMILLLGQAAIAGNQFVSYDCGDNVIGSYEKAGAYLAERIPADALIYWIGGRSPVPLLYLPQARIFPPQLNGVYTLYSGGESAELLRFGYWNYDLAEQWLMKADYVLVEKSVFKSNLMIPLSPSLFDELNPSPGVVACRPDSAIHIFRRIK